MIQRKQPRDAASTNWSRFFGDCFVGIKFFFGSSPVAPDTVEEFCRIFCKIKVSSNSLKQSMADRTWRDIRGLPTVSPSAVPMQQRMLHHTMRPVQDQASMSTSPSSSTPSQVGTSRIRFVRGKFTWLCPSGSRYLSKYTIRPKKGSENLARLKRRS